MLSHDNIWTTTDKRPGTEGGETGRETGVWRGDPRASALAERLGLGREPLQLHDRRRGGRVTTVLTFLTAVNASQ